MNNVVVIGGGAVGAFVTWALAREQRRPVLVDSCEIGVGSAAAGSAGHIATELIEPLPSPRLLATFPTELVQSGGPLSIRRRQLSRWIPWAARFARAAFTRAHNTAALAPLVRPGTTMLADALAGAGCSSLMRNLGHYEVWLGSRGAARAAAQSAHQRSLAIPCDDAPATLLRDIAVRAQAEQAAGLWFPESSHVVDPLLVLRAVVDAAISAGAQFYRDTVRAVEPIGECVRVYANDRSIDARQVVICAGVGSAELLRPLGLRVPLLAARGYHVESAADDFPVDAPVVYADHRVVLTPMIGRLRLTGMMEFDEPNRAPDMRHVEKLRRAGRRLGYRFPDSDRHWVGARPVLPDYLPGIGQVPSDPRIVYAIGHQHIGLTTAPMTANIVASLLGGRTPLVPIGSFDLTRFGRP
jgi:D-hydroxyproline dehydrogenase